MSVISRSLGGRPRLSSRQGGRLAHALRTNFLLIAAILLLAYLTLVPIAVMGISSLRPSGFLRESGWTAQNFIDTYSDPRIYRLLWSTIQFALGSSVVAVVLGTSIAWLLERTNMPGRGMFRVLIVLPMAMPPLLLAISWVLLLSPTIGVLNRWLQAAFGDGVGLNIYSMVGMVFVQGLAFTPSVYLLLAPSFRNMDSALEEAALISGASPVKMIRRILLPIMTPALLATGILVFITSLLVFDVPGLLGTQAGISVFSTAVYEQMSPNSGLPNYGSAGALAMLPLICLLPLTFVYQRVMRRSGEFVTVTGKGYRPELTDLGRWRPVAVLGVSVFFAFSVFVPFVMIFLTSLMPYYAGVTIDGLKEATFENYRAVFASESFLGSLQNTFVLGVVAATVLAILSPVISWSVVRARGTNTRLRNLADRLAFLPVSLSGTMIGLALIYVYLAFQFIPIYGTIWIIVIAHVTAFMTFSTRTVNGAMVQIHPELEEAAQTSGANTITAFRKITVPLLRPAIFVVWIWVFAHSIRELSAAVMLKSQDNSVVTTELWTYFQLGQGSVAAAVGMCLLVGLAGLALAWEWISRRSRL